LPYIDTDANYVLVGSDDLNEYKMIEKKVNEYLYPYHVDFEKVYGNVIFFAKKRYYGKVVWKDGKYKEGYDVKGLEIVRGNVFDYMYVKLFLTFYFLFYTKFEALPLLF
jgi:hypothetical protein